MTLSLPMATISQPNSLFHSIISSASGAHPSQKELWWTQGICSGASIITRFVN